MPPVSRLTDDTPLEAGPVGWHGKLPCLGDFATRRLPPAFVRGWDDWLSSVLHESRRRLGEGWIDAYLTAPLWRFVAGPGALGDRPWAGLLMSSVDRVGRHFPLTLARRLAHAPSDADGLHAALIALDCEAAAALATLTEGRPVEPFEADLARCAEVARPGSPVRGTQDPLYAACTRLVDGVGDLPSLLAGGATLWAEYADGPAVPRTHAFPGLPTAEDYIVLLCD
jgi:type VI secretion system ImpM family protein